MVTVSSDAKRRTRRTGMNAIGSVSVVSIVAVWTRTLVMRVVASFEVTSTAEEAANRARRASY